MRKLQEIILEGTFRYSDDKYEVITLFSPININKSCTKTIRQSTALSHHMHHLPKQERKIPRGCLHTQQNPIPGRRRRLSCFFFKAKGNFQPKPKKLPSCERSDRGALTQRWGRGRASCDPAPRFNPDPGNPAKVRIAPGGS